MARIKYIVICGINKEHRFEKVFEVKEKSKKKDIEETFETYCPFCGQYVQVVLDKPALENTETYKQFGFKAD
jgi:hypothetical protein